MRSDERISLASTSHLTDDQLMETYVLAADNRHLGVCRQCQARFDDLARALEQIRESAVYEADSVFPVDCLHEQRHRILRRLERQGHPAEVLMFPARSAQYPLVRRALGPARRWIAGAAAAGLAAGLFLGYAMDRRVMSTAGDRAVVQAPAAAETETMAWPAVVSYSQDEQFLIEIEDALLGPRRVLELQALDLMTTPTELREASIDLR